MNDPIVVCDIDGTIANNQHRLHYIQSQPSDWSKFYESASLDTPILPMIEIIKQLSTRAEICWLTSRPDSIWMLTARWLSLNVGLQSNRYHLMTRSPKDFRPSHEYKRSKLLEFRLRPSLLIDDDPAVIDAVRDLCEFVWNPSTIFDECGRGE